jgi:hypothetical protein
MPDNLFLDTEFMALLCGFEALPPGMTLSLGDAGGMLQKEGASASCPVFCTE